MANKNGRPLTEIDWEQVEEMCFIQCTGEEMAAILKISFDTLERAIQREHKMGFAEYYKIHASGGKKSLRRVQFDKAMDGNVPMLIWLGKQMLGQTEKVETKIDSEVQGININFGNRSNRDKYKDKDPLIVDGSALKDEND